MLNVLQVKKSFMAEELKLGDITGFSNWTEVGYSKSLQL